MIAGCVDLKQTSVTVVMVALVFSRRCGAPMVETGSDGVDDHRTINYCVSKKLPTFKLSVTLSNLNRFFKIFTSLESL